MEASCLMELIDGFLSIEEKDGAELLLVHSADFVGERTSEMSCGYDLFSGGYIVLFGGAGGGGCIECWVGYCCIGKPCP